MKQFTFLITSSTQSLENIAQIPSPSFKPNRLIFHRSPEYIYLTSWWSWYPLSGFVGIKVHGSRLYYPSTLLRPSSLRSQSLINKGRKEGRKEGGRSHVVGEE